MAAANLTAERLRELLHYDPETGVFTNRTNRQRARAGTVAGAIVSNGYRGITLEYYPFMAHRLVWLYVYGRWPAGTIDHINGDRADNRLENLRDVSHAENMQNLRGPVSRNKSGFLGVSQLRRNGKWAAFIKLNGKSRNLGSYDTPEDASRAYLIAKRRLHECCTI